jgi:hypothetical protein
MFGQTPGMLSMASSSLALTPHDSKYLRVFPLADGSLGALCQTLWSPDQLSWDYCHLYAGSLQSPGAQVITS